MFFYLWYNVYVNEKGIQKRKLKKVKKVLDFQTSLWYNIYVSERKRYKKEIKKSSKKVLTSQTEYDIIYM